MEATGGITECGLCNCILVVIVGVQRFVFVCGGEVVLVGDAWWGFDVRSASEDPVILPETGPSIRRMDHKFITITGAKEVILIVLFR